MEVLAAFCREIERHNPFGLVLKGGTALALYRFNHRESEDMDFDVDIKFRQNYQDIESYFVQIFEEIKKQGILLNYRITKSDFAATNRLHIKVELKTKRTYYSKIDLSFGELPLNVEKRGELSLYSLERMFIGKSLAFVNRKELKDLYDLWYLVSKVSAEKFPKKEETAELLQKVIKTAQTQDTKAMFKHAFRNVDLHFKDLTEHRIESFVQSTIQKLRIVGNKLKQNE